MGRSPPEPAPAKAGVLAVELANRESRSSWRDFLLGLKARGLHGVEFVVADDHAGLRAALREVLAAAAYQRCYVHFLRNALDYVPRRVDDLVQAMGLSGISKSQVSKLCKEIDERVHAFLDRPLAGEWPYLWLDATYLKQREGGRIVSVAAIIAVAANSDGRREIVGLHIGPSEAEISGRRF